MISNRLKMIASFVPKTCNLADIGSDHGYLLTYLREEGFKGKLLGVENKKGPFTNLKDHIENSNLNDIDYSFSDGINDVNDEYNCIVIAGMGFDNIKNIILSNESKLDKIKYFIIDSHTKTADVRRFFVSLGYKIKQEKILSEANIYYEIILFQRGKGVYDTLDYEFGPLLRKEKSSVFCDKYSEQLLKLNDVLHNFDRKDVRYKDIKRRIDSIEQIL